MKSMASSLFATVYASVPLLVIADPLARSRDDPHRTGARLQRRRRARQTPSKCPDAAATGGDTRRPMSWHIRGTYFESCNCDAICPCRRIDGQAGGRSTYGVCMGVLSWLIEDGDV